jgi:hypothetical protein
MTTDTDARRGINPWRAAAWSFAALILLLPLVAMRFTAEVNWTVGDFIFASLLIGSVGLTLELAVRVSPSRTYRGGVGFAVAAAFLLVWANGAVGMIGNEDNPYNLLFLGVIPLALLGAVVARFRAAGMAWAMALAGLAQAGIAIGGMPADLRGGVLSALLAGLWVLSAALFRNAAGEPAAAS